MQSTALDNARPPTAWGLFLIFSRIGLTSFGGGLSGWLLREFVQDRHWMQEEAFLNGLAVSQALPGVNVTNMAIWIGFHLVGPRGAAAALAGIILPPAVLAVLLSVAFALLSGYPLVHIWLDGAAAAAIGLSLSMAIRAVRRVRRQVLPLFLVALVFVMIIVLHQSLVWVVVAVAPVSVALEYARLRMARKRA
ncbi:chromate transporter [Bordetella sp. FB-8]|uniref:chromate transporter n=1 Tax=Bordetella sp. FB-8 TaxID=1159870 RepID=UPI00036B9786|nr:chromate transporter [Bordetella sp. FB-8]